MIEVVPGKFWCEPQDVESLQWQPEEKSRDRYRDDQDEGVWIVGRTMSGGSMGSPSPKFRYFAKGASIDEISERLGLKKPAPEISKLMGLRRTLTERFGFDSIGLGDEEVVNYTVLKLMELTELSPLSAGLQALVREEDKALAELQGQDVRPPSPPFRDGDDDKVPF